jgi:hypothetical protein
MKKDEKEGRKECREKSSGGSSAVTACCVQRFAEGKELEGKKSHRWIDPTG